MNSTAYLGRCSPVLETVQAQVGSAPWLRTRYSYGSGLRRCRLGMRAVFLALGIFPAAVSRGRTLAPVHVFNGLWDPPRTCEIAPSSHLDLAHSPSDVFVAAIDRERTKATLSGRRCREQSDGGQESHGDYGFHHRSSSWTMRPVAAVDGSPRAGELRPQ